MGLDDDEVSQSEADQYRIHELEQKIAHQDGVIASLKSHQVLQNVYTQKLQRQLHTKERSTEKGKSRSNTRLLGDGLPVVLSGDEFYERVAEHDQRKREEEKRKEQAIKARGNYAKEKELWDKAQAERKRLVEDRRRAYKEEMEDWEARKAEAKQKKTHFRQPKPLLGLKNIPKCPPRPVLRSKHTEHLEEGEFFDLDAVEEEDESDDEDNEGTQRN